MLQFLGRWIGRRAAVVVLLWALMVAGGAWWAWTTPPVPPMDLGSILPEKSPHNQAMLLLQQAFPQLAARSQIVIVATRADGLSPVDFDWLKNAAQQAQRATTQPVLSPVMPFLKERLVSEDGKVAMIVVNLPSNFISAESVEAVRYVDEIVAAAKPPGLVVEMTGLACMGRDYAAATSIALHRTTWVTVIAVLVILVVVYRSPIGALVPLVSIGASVFLAMVILAAMSIYGGRWGIHVSDMERLFAVVLIFGAGIDYAIFWIARYRELLHDTPDLATAAETATVQAGPAIIASAATSICGLTTLIAAQLTPSQSSGKVLAPVLLVALLAAISLSPALTRLLGRTMFWPVGVNAKSGPMQRRVWPYLADWVTGRPMLVLMVGMVLLAIPALWCTRLQPSFDSLSELPPGSSSRRGLDILNNHFSPGQLFATQVLVEFEDRHTDAATQARVAAQLSPRLAAVSGVEDVYSLDAPVGRRNTSLARQMMIKLLSSAAEKYYRSEAMPVLRFEVLLQHPPFSLEAMDLDRRLRDVASTLNRELYPEGHGFRIWLSGVTPYIVDVRSVAGRDQWTVMILATVVIAVIVLILVRNPWLTVFMVGATWLTYGATVTVAHLFFSHVLHEGGLDWKVRLILFVIVVAVGQDYNIFLVSRLLQLCRLHSESEAVRLAIVRTGAVISSCGVIMAATLGSLWAGQLSLLRQVGFSLALGILIDTFFVRPLLIPSFFLLMTRLGLRRSSPSLSVSASQPVKVQNSKL